LRTEINHQGWPRAPFANCPSGKSLRVFRNGLSSPFCKNISVLA
jgi:hypothetical protein